MQEKPQINFIIPLYNEQEVFSQLTDRLIRVIEDSPLSITVIMVDDGSQDLTPALMHELAMKDDSFVAVFLSRNHGHQLALSAGLSQIDATEAILVLDGDLQDPPELIDEFYKHYQDGYDVVYAERSSKEESSFKRITSKYFYHFFDKITKTKIPLNTGDFAFISRRVADLLNQMPEERRFIRGMRSWVGFKQKGIFFEREKRKHGETKYTLKKMLRLALDGIFSFSEVPIKLITRLGLFAISTSLIFLIVTVIRKFYFNDVVEGFSALIFAIVLFGGVQLVCIGILGEYIVRIFFQVKNRPLYIIDKTIKNKQKENGKTVL